MNIPHPPNGKSIRALLKWPLTIQFHHKQTCEVVSDPGKHVVYLPAQPKDQIRWLEVQHEFAHCWLAETVHLQFATSLFKRGTPDELLLAISPIIRSAQDWFVDEVLYQQWPKEEKAAIHEHVNMFRRALSSVKESLPPDIVWGGTLMLAQAQRHKCCKKECRKIFKKFPDCEKIVRVFLSVDPSNPSIEASEQLLNKLLKIASNGQLRIELIDDADREVWEIHSGNSAHNAASRSKVQRR